MADHQSFEDFAAREFPVLVASLTYHCGDVEVARELAQDALARAYQRWRRVATMDRPGAWVQTVAFNLSRSRFRRRGAERRALARHGARPDVAHELDGPGVVEVRVDVHRAVALLPPRQREAVIHVHLLDHSIAETAERLGVSAAAVKSALHKGRANLARHLAPPATDHAESANG